MNEIYKSCMMCRMIDYNGIRINEEAYLKAGGNPEFISHGVCQDQDCQAANIMLTLGCNREEAESVLEKILKDKTNHTKG